MTANRRSTNFFERQDEARSNCRNLVLLFVIAVLCIIVAIYFAFRLVRYIYIITEVIKVTNHAGSLGKTTGFAWWDPASFIIVFIVVSLFILIASLIKLQQLQKGGGAVAEMLGGRLVPNNTSDRAERQLLNVVEEMAIASGIPVPPVYILDREDGINAFAAGLTINDAAIAVTQGAVDVFTRDEMQGVIAHEFSHILNGDMRLNIQLIGIIYGILIIGIIGGEILESHRISSKSIVLFLAGILLVIIGYIGTFAGRLIQSAVSRQKEFLADASAVKFTRNPNGLASALKKIGGYIFGSEINSATAKQASHLFFGESHLDTLFPDFLATHPPLFERILCLDPSFDGIYPKVTKGVAHYEPPLPRISPIEMSPAAASTLAGLSLTAKAIDIVDLVGKPAATHLDRSAVLLTSIPDKIRQELKTPADAANFIFALLLGKDCRERELQLEAIARASAIAGNKDEALRLCSLTENLSEDQKLPLIEIALPQLRSLIAAEKRNFTDTIDSLIDADGKVTLFEFSVRWIIQQSLTGEAGKLFGETAFTQISQVGYQTLTILRVLANAGNTGNADAARLSFNDGLERIPELACKNTDYFYTENINFAEINTALKKLTCSSFKIKQVIIDACAHCAFADNSVTTPEAELLRVISLALGCPLPPFLPKQ
jgi:Zn-dependent protease with chaperone function